MSNYRYQEPAARAFSVLPAGDYMAVINEAEEPYEKNGKQVMKTVLAIQPSGQTVFYYPWAGHTQGGEYRDSIGELLLAANRAPASGEEPKWAKLAGAKVKVRLKVEPDQNGIDRNVIHYVYTPKTVKPGSPQEEKQQSFSQSDFQKARKQQQAAAGEPEPSDIPY
jgi:hypothetical protein